MGSIKINISNGRKSGPGDALGQMFGMNLANSSSANNSYI
jgi:hypothetical protein